MQKSSLLKMKVIYPVVHFFRILFSDTRFNIGPNWRSFVKENLSGNGIEIGALHEPFPYNDRTTMRYVDHQSTEELRKIYLHDKNVPINKIVDVDYICDGQKLPMLADESADFVCNSHLLEHLPNPGRAIEEWLRVVKSGGLVYIVAPDKRYTFDKRRRSVSLEHLQKDFINKISEVEHAHYQDYMANVNQITDPVQHQEAYKVQRNIHIHAWDYDTLKKFVEWLQGKLTNFILVDSKLYEIHIVLLLKKK